MKTIETRYIGPSNTKGSRIVATDCGDHRIYVPFDHAARCAHDVAMKALCLKLGWHGEFVKGSTKTGFVYVWANDERVTIHSPNWATVEDWDAPQCLRWLAAHTPSPNHFEDRANNWESEVSAYAAHEATTPDEWEGEATIDLRRACVESMDAGR